MKILMISDVFFPRVNGVSTSIQTFREELSALGHEVHLIVPAYPGDHHVDVRINRVASRKVLFDPEDRLMKAAEIDALIPHLRTLNFDLLHIQTPFRAHYAGIKIARALNIPCVETYHTFFEEYLHHYIPFLPRPFTRAITRAFSRSQCNQVDAIIAPSTAMADVLKRYGCTSPIHISPTGIPLDRFDSGDGARFRAQHDIPEHRPLLVHIGRVAHEKNIGFLLKVVARLRVDRPDILLLICGEGPALPDLQEEVQRLALDDQVMLVGYLDRETELLDCYRAADVFVFASRTETQGLVLLEAMALGVPVVSTAMMGTIDIVSPQKGALAALEDIEDFSSKVARVLSDRALRATMSADGREHVKAWSAPATATRLVMIYETVMERNRVMRQTGSAGASQYFSEMPP